MLIRTLLVALALTASSLAAGDSLEPPERIARLSYVQGEVTFQGAQEVAPSALPDRPLNPGDRLTTLRDGRAELALGNATLRLDEATAVTMADLDASTVRLEFTTGTASVHLRELFEGETFEVVTLNTTIAFRTPGEYRVDITPSGATELSVRAGNAEVATAGGPVRVADGQRVRLEGRAEFASLVTPRAADDFDEWVLEREVQFAESAPPPGEPSDGDEYGNETLDQYGEWRDEPDYGRVWMPSYAYGGYDPFSHGYWQRSSFGYSWYDPMPWSAYTFNYGRWTYLDHLNRWCWVPERRRHRDHFAHDTRPYRQPRSGDHWDDDRDDRDDRNDRPWNGNPRPDADEPQPVASSSGLGRPHRREPAARVPARGRDGKAHSQDLASADATRRRRRARPWRKTAARRCGRRGRRVPTVPAARTRRRPPPRRTRASRSRRSPRTAPQSSTCIGSP